VQAAGTATTTVTNGFDLYNGSTWTTTQPYQVVTTLNGTTPASGFVQLTAAQLAGFQQIRPDTSSSPAGTNAMTYNSITYSCYH
jgi:hypothetical protein